FAQFTRMLLYPSIDGRVSLNRARESKELAHLALDFEPNAQVTDCRPAETFQLRAGALGGGLVKRLVQNSAPGELALSSAMACACTAPAGTQSDPTNSPQRGGGPRRECSRDTHHDPPPAP